MLLVKTKVLPSAIQGLGLFADEDISAGTVIWRFTQGFDMKFSPETVNNFPTLIREHIETYGWLSQTSGQYCLCSDNAKYFNHSHNPNSQSAHYDHEEEVVTKAIRDIRSGEEITSDYASFEADFDEKYLF